MNMSIKKEYTQCAICLEDVWPVGAVELDCGSDHLLHYECYMQWEEHGVDEEGVGSCPYCRGLFCCYTTEGIEKEDALSIGETTHVSESEIISIDGTRDDIWEDIPFQFDNPIQVWRCRGGYVESPLNMPTNAMLHWTKWTDDYNSTTDCSSCETRL